MSGPARARSFTGASALPRAHALLDRLIRGRLWIAVVAFALIGVVTMQLGMLKLNAGIGRALEHEAALQRENSALSVEVSEIGAPETVESQAAHLGMQLIPPGAMRFLSPQGSAPALARAAAAALARSASEASTTAGEASTTASASTAGTPAGAGSETHSEAPAESASPAASETAAQAPTETASQAPSQAASPAPSEAAAQAPSETAPQASAQPPAPAGESSGESAGGSASPTG